MRSTMMDVPLLVSSVLRHAARFHGETALVSQTVEGPIHRTTYAKTWRRSGRLAPTRAGTSARYAGKVARWCVPDGVRFATEFPHAATGNLLKTKIRALYANSSPNEAARSALETGIIHWR